MEQLCGSANEDKEPSNTEKEDDNEVGKHGIDAVMPMKMIAGGQRRYGAPQLLVLVTNDKSWRANSGGADASCIAAEKVISRCLREATQHVSPTWVAAGGFKDDDTRTMLAGKRAIPNRLRAFLVAGGWRVDATCGQLQLTLTKIQGVTVVQRAT
ncbi:hypothetical protein BDB00DRAFT_874843 [Zychaea mexicana]|uniref:uncharacterized protein n=1 Tax=Zychaea mexicana TaxID=64656 RepID=UPI0022FEBCA1|nr:uncharacterized protein BDB00DRAFT_874843 [Zychaea mexicana]KAI9491001.1 hypothetical protein BDB00DRAFT_874843 [Zychaea mexicana]